ncbi:MAG TPA: TolC family protein [Persephonella sp.]|nr:TolC family protein [Persephonella sp.]
MNMRGYLLVIITTLFSIAMVSYGVDLKSIIDEGRKSNPELIKIKERLKVYQYKKEFEGSLEDPVVSFSITDIQLFYRPFSRQIEPMQAVVIGISQKIPYFGKLDLKEQIVQKKYDSEYYRLKASEQKVLKNIYISAYKLWKIDEKLKIIKKYQDVASQIIKLSNTLYAVGKSSQSDVINAQIYYTQLKEMEINLKNLKERVKAKLSSLVNRDIESVSLDLPEPDGKPDLSQFIERMKNNSPYLAYIKEKIKEKDYQIKLSKKDYRPDFRFFANYAYRQGFNDYLTVGVSFNIPVWQKSRQDMKVLEKTQEKTVVQKEYQEKLTDLTYQLEDRYYKLNDALQTYRLLKDIYIKQTEKGFESIIAEYKVGKKNMIDLLYSLKQILSVKLKIIDEIYSYNEALIEIKELSGDLK